MAVEPWRVPDALWAEIAPLLPRVERRFRHPGRKRVDDRVCLEGILYVLRYAIPWRALPQIAGFPSGQTCWRRLDEWERAGVWSELLARLQARLAASGEIDWSRAIADASLVAVKRGAPRRGRARPIAANRHRNCISAATVAASR
jgi:transposase